MIISNPKVSVVIPFYNTPSALLKKCLESVEKVDPYEIILVNDCSTDSSTIGVVKSFVKENEKSRYYETTKQSGCDGVPFNLGVSKATGDYICRVDSDDELLSLPVLKKKTPVVFGKNNRNNVKERLTIESLILSPRSVINGSLIHKDVIKKYPSPEDINVYGDVLLALQLMDSTRYTISDVVNYKYNHVNGSMQTSRTYTYHRLRLVQTVARFCQLRNKVLEESSALLELALLNLKYGSNSLAMVNSDIDDDLATTSW